MQFSKLGLLAAELAADLRRVVKLPDRTENEHWDPVSEMQRKRETLVEREKVRREKFAKLSGSPERLL